MLQTESLSRLVSFRPRGGLEALVLLGNGFLLSLGLPFVGDTAFLLIGSSIVIGGSDLGEINRPKFIANRSRGFSV